MKIAIVNLDLAAPLGDTRCVGSFAPALQRLGHEVVVFTTAFNPGPFGDAWKEVDIRIIPQEKSLEEIVTGKAATVLAKVLRKIRTNQWAHAAARSIAEKMDANFDVVDCHNWYAYKAAPYCRKKNPHARIIWTMHDTPFNYRPKKNPVMNFLSKLPSIIEPWFERRFYKHTQEIIVMDERSAPLAPQFGAPVRLLYLGVDSSHFYHKVKTRRKGDTRVRLIGVGALSPYRRFEDIVSAVALLRKRGYDASATILCRDYWENRAYRNEFIEYVEKSGAAPYIDVNFEGVSEAGLLEAYKKSDVFIFPNHIKIWGLAAFEGMAAGLPLVVSSITSVAEVTKENENALFVEPLSPEQIADKVELLVNDPALYRKIATNGQEFVKEELSWDAYASRFLGSESQDDFAKSSAMKRYESRNELI